MITTTTEANHNTGFVIQMAFQNGQHKKTQLSLAVLSEKNSTETSKTMNKQIAQVTWSQGCYSDIFRTAIVEPLPIKEGQQVCVI